MCTVFWETAQWRRWHSICWALLSARHSTRHFTNTSSIPTITLWDRCYLHVIGEHTEDSFSLRCPHLDSGPQKCGKCGTQSEGRWGPIQEETSKDGLQCPSPSGQVRRHEVDVFSWTDFNFLPSFCLYLSFLFGSISICMVLVRREITTAATHHGCQGGLTLPLPLSVQPSWGDLSDRVRKVSVVSQESRSWTCGGKTECMGVTFLISV